MRNRVNCVNYYETEGVLNYLSFVAIINVNFLYFKYIDNIKEN